MVNGVQAVWFRSSWRSCRGGEGVGWGWEMEHWFPVHQMLLEMTRSRVASTVSCTYHSPPTQAAVHPPSSHPNPATHLMPLEMTRLRVASTVSCTAAVQFIAPLLVT